MSMKNFRKMTGRSFSSWLIERLMFVSGMKKKQEKRLQQQVKQLIQRNTKAQPNPEALVGNYVQEFHFGQMQVFTWNEQETNNQPIIFYLHGGSNANPPSTLHYFALRHIVELTDAKVIMPIYLKTPKYTYLDSLPGIYALYLKLLVEKKEHRPIILMGDSSGGGIALGLANELYRNGIEQPAQLILLSPWLDMTNSHPAMSLFDHYDPMLSKAGLDLASSYWIGQTGDVADPRVSPKQVLGRNVAPITMFVGTRELFYPDVMAYSQQLKEEQVAHHLYVYKKMNHIFSIYPTPEGYHSRQLIAQIINNLNG